MLYFILGIIVGLLIALIKTRVNFVDIPSLSTLSKNNKVVIIDPTDIDLGE